MSQTKEKRAVYNKTYRAIHREELKAYFKTRRIGEIRDKDNARRKNRHAAHREAENAYMRNYSMTHKQERRAYAANHRKENYGYRLKRVYKKTPAEIIAILNRQGGRCAICSTDKPGKKGWSIDHDHIIKQVRGILCMNCNLMLGNARDIPSILRIAANYLCHHNIWYEEDMPEKLKQMNAEQTQLDSLDREEQRAN